MDEFSKALKADGEKLIALTGKDHGPWNISDADIQAAMLVGDPLREMQEQRLEEIRARLAEGVPVTLTCDSKKLCTFYPDGTIEHHDFAWGSVPPDRGAAR